MDRIDDRRIRSGITTLHPNRHPFRHTLVEAGDQFIHLLKWHSDSLDSWDQTVTAARSSLPRALAARNDFRHAEQFAATCKDAFANYLRFTGSWTKAALQSNGAPEIRNDYFIMPPEGPTRWRGFIAETRWNDRLKREVFAGWWTVAELTPGKGRGEQQKFYQVYQQEWDFGQGLLRRPQLPGRYRHNRRNGWFHRRRALLEQIAEVVEAEAKGSKASDHESQRAFVRSNRGAHSGSD
jgi:hypothetical protein